MKDNGTIRRGNSLIRAVNVSFLFIVQKMEKNIIKYNISGSDNTVVILKNCFLLKTNENNNKTSKKTLLRTLDKGIDIRTKRIAIKALLLRLSFFKS